MEAVLPDIPEMPSRKKLLKVSPAQGERRYRVALLTGCVMDVVYGGINEATVRVLTRNGCDVVIPERQRCCGALQVHAGDARDGQGVGPAKHRRFSRCRGRPGDWNATGWVGHAGIRGSAGRGCRISR